MRGIPETIRRRTIRCRLAHQLTPLVRTATVLVGVMGLLAGCGALDVSDPTAIEEEELNDAAGAALLRGAALRAVAEAADDGAFYSGLLADEFRFNLRSGGTPGTFRELLDRREAVELDRDLGYGPWQELRHAAAAALPKLRTYAPPGAAEAQVGEMFALRGFGTLRLAEDICPGFPLHELVEFQLIAGPPHSTDAALARALADFDSAVVLAADSLRVLRFAQVARARTLLALGRFADAGLAVEGVPTDYAARAEYLSGTGPINSLSFTPGAFLDHTVADQEGGTGLDFVSAGDPRVQLTPIGTDGDGVTILYRSAKYPDRNAPIVLASGIEARLIEAEAALQADPASGGWLAILNALRTTCTDVATCPDPAPAGSGEVDGLPPLTDPGTAEERINLLFRERAFWLFATGHRLADLRRLVNVYGRTAESVFPAGTYRLGGPYGTATSIRFPATNETPFNPAVTGCTSQ